ncbi:NAD-dependent succinate-semialdehyde dehydrogenase [Kluyveromyces lactis]|uniref:Succinate-semialdehyde dehydrogenase, mitochondrial n=1 Tax=Kluyveromyces lactis (strain ATCC 8585 / CBS 2359 / DSM 70799 / NBRC 1267 / NRRL Y-1140 / WM37) TaxID=284590 RepID=Q6CK88_KLULA|nr:uncharacterized protein KLLA0_F12628g [Kluyveromyces lactis]CAG98359.1 KLLA0F12628p [Kluyveromyces lactis]|eukprot:XP_455651.1 uncharacterized protein KLLA0_F12628g [Kluyveromyces lactis]
MFRNSNTLRTLNLLRKMSSKIENDYLIQTKAFINGKWTETDDKFAVTNPSTGDTIREVTNCGVSDFNKAIEIAHDAFGTFRQTNVRERAQILDNIYNLMLENKQDLAKILTLENGKPYKDSLGEIVYSAMFFKWFAEEAPRIYGDIIPSAVSSDQKIFTIRQPLGVIGILTPWNFPSAMIARKLAPVIATGNTCVIKPAHETPLSALALGVIAEKAGLPAGVCNILPTNHTSEIGEYVCEHELVKKITFTGSTKIGQLLMGQSSKGKNIKKFSMELGGNAPYIVFKDADLDRALDGIIGCKFRQSGQTCICANRIFVHEDLYDEFSKRLVDKIDKTFKLGDGFQDGVTHGPLIHDKSIDKVASLVQDAKTKGADVLIGGSRASSLGPLFYQPTVLGNVTESMDIFYEEIFGPVAPLIKFKDVDEVIKRANDTDVGLAGYFYSQNISTIFDAAEKLNVGMVGVNTGEISEPAVPFGGVKNSGLGKEGSKYGIDDYTELKAIIVAP